MMREKVIMNMDERKVIEKILERNKIESNNEKEWGRQRLRGREKNYGREMNCGCDVREKGAREKREK